MSNREDIPAEIRLQVRQESIFGCAACGCPVIEYHHIIPFHEVKKHEFENIVALCPTCHTKAHESGPWSQEYVRTLKASPFNKNNTKDRFATHSDNFIIKLGWIEFHIQGDLIALDDEIVLSCIRNKDGILVISGRFYDIHGNLIAVIDENEWIIKTTKVWDVEYSLGKRLIVRTGKRQIVLRLEITTDSLDIQQCFFIKGRLKLKQFSAGKNSKLLIEATNAFLSSNNERVIVKGPIRGPALRLR